MKHAGDIGGCFNRSLELGLAERGRHIDDNRYVASDRALVGLDAYVHHRGAGCVHRVEPRHDRGGGKLRLAWEPRQRAATASASATRERERAREREKERARERESEREGEGVRE